MLFKADPGQVRAGWFIESVLSERWILLVIRSQRRFYRSAPRREMGIAVTAVSGVTALRSRTPLGAVFGL